MGKSLSSNMKKHSRTSSFRIFASIGLLVSLFLGAMMPQSTYAAETGGITVVSATPASVVKGGQFAVSADITTPSGTQANDTVTLNFDSHVVGVNSNITLDAPDGSVIANCVVANTTLTCAYTDYVNTHANVSATLTFVVIGNTANGTDGLNWTTPEGQTFHTDNTITPIGNHYPTTLGKRASGLTDGSVAFRAYFTTHGMGSAKTVTDTYGPDLIPDKASLNVWDIIRNPDGTTSSVHPTVDPSEYQVTWDDANNSFSIYFPNPKTRSDDTYRFNIDMVPGPNVKDGGTVTNYASDATNTVHADYTFLTVGGSGDGSTGSVSWEKVNESKQPLGGATFTIAGSGDYSETINDNSSLDTDKRDGYFKVESLPLGSYNVKETVSPQGYKLSTETHEAAIVPSTLDVSAGTFVNQKIASDPGEPGTPDTGGLADTGSNTWVYATIGTLTLLGGIAALRKIRA